MGNFPALEKGPLTKILGGPELLDHEDLKDVKYESSKSMVLVVICFSGLFVCVFFSFLKKLKYRKLDHYRPDFNRFKSVYNLFSCTYVMFGKNIFQLKIL